MAGELDSSDDSIIEASVPPLWGGDSSHLPLPADGELCVQERHTAGAMACPRQCVPSNPMRKYYEQTYACFDRNLCVRSAPPCSHQAA